MRFIESRAIHSLGSFFALGSNSRGAPIVRFATQANFGAFLWRFRRASAAEQRRSKKSSSDCLTSRATVATLTRLACVGGRWFPLETADKQGTPVKNRDGPAAVTECFVEGKLIRAIVLLGLSSP